MPFEKIQPLVTWVAPILSTLIITWLTAVINGRMEESKRDEKREQEERKEWRAGVDKKLAEQDSKIDTILNAQCTLMRTDLIHKAHRYIDDLGCAGLEEKQAFHAEYDEYQRICDANEIVNHFVDKLVEQVMGLPDRSTRF